MLKDEYYYWAEKRTRRVVQNNVSYKNGYPRYKRGQDHKCEKCGNPVRSTSPYCAKCRQGGACDKRSKYKGKSSLDLNNFPKFTGRKSYRAPQKETK